MKFTTIVIVVSLISSSALAESPKVGSKGYFKKCGNEYTMECAKYFSEIEGQEALFEYLKSECMPIYDHLSNYEWQPWVHQKWADWLTERGCYKLNAALIRL